jgi:hypothetical protein
MKISKSVYNSEDKIKNNKGYTAIALSAIFGMRGVENRAILQNFI